MNTFSLTHVEDHKLYAGLAAAVANERGRTAEVLAWIAEFDARKLYLPAAYPTMYALLIAEFNLSEGAAYKRLRSARAAYEHPVIFDMVGDGRLHLSAIVMLAAHLTPVNAQDLLTAASRKTKAQIELLLAERFPQSDRPETIRPVVPAPASNFAASVPLEASAFELAEPSSTAAQSLSPGTAVPLDDAKVRAHEVPLSPPTRVAPIAPERFALQVTLMKSTHDKLRRAQELLSHSLPSGDIATVLDRALDVLVEKLEKRRHAVTSRPSTRRRSKSARHVPAHVRRAVSDRDRYQCTFVSAAGRRCVERRFLEYDHVHPVARGGQATVENTRLRCRAHNQFEAERVYGAGFMREKREASGVGRRTSAARSA